MITMYNPSNEKFFSIEKCKILTKEDFGPIFATFLCSSNTLGVWSIGPPPLNLLAQGLVD